MRPRPPPAPGAQPDWFVCGVCNRSQAYAPAEDPGGVTVEEAEAFGWRWVEDSGEEWLCPLHSGTAAAATYEHRPHEHMNRAVMSSFLMSVVVSFAALAFRAAALAWCWGHFAVALWSRAPHVQAWQFFGLLVLKPLVIYPRDDGEEDHLILSERMRRQRRRVVGSVAGTALSWAVVWLLVRLFGG